MRAGSLNGEWQEMRCAHETPSGFRAPTTISPIRLRLLGEMVAHLAQGYAPRPLRRRTVGRRGKRKLAILGQSRMPESLVTTTSAIDFSNVRLWLTRPPAPEPSRSSFGKSAESDVSPVGYVDPRMWCEQSSIIFEHCSMLFEFRSMSVDSVTIAKPSGLGMVSFFKASEVRMLFCVFSPIDARRIRRL